MGLFLLLRGACRRGLETWSLVREDNVGGRKKLPVPFWGLLIRIIVMMGPKTLF